VVRSQDGRSFRTERTQTAPGMSPLFVYTGRAETRDDGATSLIRTLIGAATAGITRTAGTGARDTPRHCVDLHKRVIRCRYVGDSAPHIPRIIVKHRWVNKRMKLLVSFRTDIRAAKCNLRQTGKPVRAFTPKCRRGAPDWRAQNRRKLAGTNRRTDYVRPSAELRRAKWLTRMQ
jgi:hypothetical protein